MLEYNKCYLGDCLSIMNDIVTGSIDLILCDLPYGTTRSFWDKELDLRQLWEHYERIITDKGVIVLFGSQPFTSKLVMSNLNLFKYALVWEKSKASNFIHSKYQTLKAHEDVLIYSKGGCTNGSKVPMTYNPQFTDGKPYNKGVGQKKLDTLQGGLTARSNIKLENKTGKRYPRSVKYFRTSESDIGKGLHPTQKPIALLEDLILTFSNENELVLDNTAGSGSTAIAAMTTNRKYIMIEQDEEYFNKMCSRISSYKGI